MRTITPIKVRMVAPVRATIAMIISMVMVCVAPIIMNVLSFTISPFYI